MDVELTSVVMMVETVVAAGVAAAEAASVVVVVVVLVVLTSRFVVALGPAATDRARIRRSGGCGRRRQ